MVSYEVVAVLKRTGVGVACLAYNSVVVDCSLILDVNLLFGVESVGAEGSCLSGADKQCSVIVPACARFGTALRITGLIVTRA